jgi:hypothetical protein
MMSSEPGILAELDTHLALLIEGCLLSAIFRKDE